MTTSKVAASVVFLKLQEFAPKPVSEQARLRAQLEAVMAVSASHIPPGDRIILDAADGAAIVVLGDPRGALRLAEQVLAASAVGLPLCVGVNHGAAQLAGDQGNGGMIGDGIAVAASIAEFASPGSLLTSRSFREAMADIAPGSEAALFPAGVFSDAGLRSHELFGLERQAATRRQKRLSMLAVVAAIGIVGASVAVRASAVGHEKFLAATVGQLRVTAAHGEHYLRGLIDRIAWQDGN